MLHHVVPSLLRLLRCLPSFLRSLHWKVNGANLFWEAPFAKAWGTANSSLSSSPISFFASCFISSAFFLVPFSLLKTC